MTPHLTFFSNKGGMGKTSLVYHCAYMFAERGLRVLVADLDPQSNLSIMALDEARLEALWSNDVHPLTLYGAVAPLFDGTGDVQPAHIELLTRNLGLLVGDVALSSIEDDLSIEWPRCLEGRERAFRVTTAFWRVIDDAARRHHADIVLLDVGSNLGAINRAALVASSHVVMPVIPNLTSLLALNSLGLVLQTWRADWSKARACASDEWSELPQGAMHSIGYILMSPTELYDYSSKTSAQWQTKFQLVYQQSVLGMPASPDQDNNSLLQRIKNYRSLMPMAMEARKPMFSLSSADGAIGAHQTNVQQCYDDFSALTQAIAARIGLEPHI